MCMFIYYYFYFYNLKRNQQISLKIKMISLRNYTSYSSSFFNNDSSYKSYFYNNNNSSQSSYSNNYRSLRMLNKQRSENGKRVRFSDEFLFWSAIKENDLNSFKMLIQKIDQKDVNRINQLGNKIKFKF
jgi:hypothetical protein